MQTLRSVRHASGGWRCAGPPCALEYARMPLGVRLGTASPRLPQAAAVSTAE